VLFGAALGYFAGEGWVGRSGGVGVGLGVVSLMGACVELCVQVAGELFVVCALVRVKL
jgi:hypothetical protein